MKRREPMKNLWMKSTPVAMPSFIHMTNGPIRHFVPSAYPGQAFDPLRCFRFIPLRAFSY